MKEGETRKLHTFTLLNLKTLNQNISQPRKTTKKTLSKPPLQVQSWFRNP